MKDRPPDLDLTCFCFRKGKKSRTTAETQEEGQENDGYESLNTYTTLNVSTTRAAQTSSFFEEPIDPEYLEFQLINNNRNSAQSATPTEGYAHPQ